MLYSISQQPYYDSCSQLYRQILTINQVPEGPLKTRVKRINNPPLSTFQSPPSQFCARPSCIYAIYNQCNELLCPEQIPDFFQYLTENEYTFDYQMSNMMMQTNVKQNYNTLLCYIKYNKK